MEEKKTLLILNNLCFTEQRERIEDLGALFHCRCVFSDIHEIGQNFGIKNAEILIFRDGEGAAGIREAFPNAILIVLWNPAETAFTFVDLKEHHNIDYVIETPFDIQEAAAVLRHVLNKGTEAEKDLPEELLKNYVQTIPSKIDRIAACADLLRSEKTIEAAAVLKKEVHKIAGNAPAYGFRHVGDLCRGFELFMVEVLGESPSEESLNQVLSRLPAFLRNLRLFYQKIQIQVTYNQDGDDKSDYRNIERENRISLEEKESDGKEIEPVVLLVTSDSSLARSFQNQFAEEDVEIRVEPVARNLLEWLSTTQTLPKCVVLESFYPEIRMSGKEIVAKLLEKDVERRCVFTLIVDEDELVDRIEALEEGFHFMIKRTFPDEHLESLKRALEYRQQTMKVRVLHVDDDKDVTALVAASLRKRGLIVECLGNEAEILEKLESFKPDVLLLDLGLAQYDGLNLLKTIRMDMHNQEMIIIIFTAKQSEETAIEVYDAGADEIIFKPFHAELVIARILNIVKRHHQFGIKRASDKTTSMLNRLEFYQSFHTAYNIPAKQGRQVSLILLQMDYLGVKGQCGFYMLIDMSYRFAEAIRQYFKSAQLLGRFGEGLFGLIIDRMSGGEIEYLLARFRDYISKNLPLVGKEGYRVDFSSGVCILRVGDEPLDAVAAAAEKALEKASRLGPGSLEIVRFKKEWASGAATGDEIVIINKDKNISNLLSLGFKKKGVTVKQITSGAEAKSYFLNLTSHDHKRLVLMEHPLPDMEITELVRMISLKFSNQIPILCLSATTEENEVVKMLNAGASDVIFKPYSAKVLFNKSLRLLYG